MRRAIDQVKVVQKGWIALEALERAGPLELVAGGHHGLVEQVAHEMLWEVRVVQAVELAGRVDHVKAERQQRKT